MRGPLPDRRLRAHVLRCGARSAHVADANAQALPQADAASAPWKVRWLSRLVERVLKVSSWSVIRLFHPSSRSFLTLKSARDSCFKYLYVTNRCGGGGGDF
jgi:hypothetical protein